MMKRIISLFAALTLLCGLLCGCADQGGTGGTDNPRITSNVTSSPAPVNTDNLPTGSNGGSGNGGGQTGSDNSGNPGNSGGANSGL